MKILLACVLVILACVAASCGGTRVITKTHVVHKQPCATVKLLNACMVDAIGMQAENNGFNPREVRAKCSRAGGSWSCLVRAPYTGGSVCLTVTVQLTKALGLPFPSDGTFVDKKRCNAAFGVA